MAECGTTAMALASALATGGRNLGAMKTSRFCLIIIIVRKNIIIIVIKNFTQLELLHSMMSIAEL